MIIELLAQLKEADSEIDNLVQYIRFLMSQMAQYVPVKGDLVDEALAKYINQQADKTKLKVMFIRLNPGIYQFGSKKVCIRVEQGKIIIRVGGGYMQIEEFLEQYTTIELEKSIREGIDPMGGPNSPFRVPGKKPPALNDISPTRNGNRSPSPKKLLHRINASPVPGSKQGQWMVDNSRPQSP